MTAPRVAMLARHWIGTPYAHQHAALGVGCDCLGLVRGVHEALTGVPVRVPPYNCDGDADVLMAGLERNLLPRRHEGLGRVLVFARRPGGPARHLGIQVAADRMVHCLERRGVREDDIGRTWRRRLIAVFAFREAG